MCCLKSNLKMITFPHLFVHKMLSLIVYSLCHHKTTWFYLLLICFSVPWWATWQDPVMVRQLALKSLVHVQISGRRLSLLDVLLAKSACTSGLSIGFLRGFYPLTGTHPNLHVSEGPCMFQGKKWALLCIAIVFSVTVIVVILYFCKVIGQQGQVDWVFVYWKPWYVCIRKLPLGRKSWWCDFLKSCPNKWFSCIDFQ